MKARIIFSLAAVFILVGCATHSYAPPSVDYFQRGQSNYEKGDYDLAIQNWTEAIRRNQNKAAAYGNRGLAYAAKGKHDLAMRDLTEVIRLDPKNAAAYYNRGIAYAEKDEYNLAIRDCTEAIHLDPKNAAAYNNRGWAYNKKGEYNLAIRDYNEAIHLDPKHTLAYENRGIAIRARDEKAETKLREAEKTRQREAAELNRAQRKVEVVAPRMKPTQVSWRAPGKTRILSVGVGNFKDTAIPRIDYAESDARGFASLAKSSGIPEENISHLTNKGACRNDITDALIKLKMATTESSETAIFYFSGHGAPLIKNGKIVDAALVPYDAGENSLEYTGIKISMLRELLSDTRGNWIVILDACFSGREGRSLMAKNIKGICVVPRDFTVAPKSTKNNWWITATSGDNFANDFPKENHGLFTYYFLKALNGEKNVDANEDGLISVKEAFNWTKKEVSAVSAKSLGRLQVPELIGKGDTILTIPR
jgi:tetratricopeptide (TPR) repeat protein